MASQVILFVGQVVIVEEGAVVVAVQLPPPVPVAHPWSNEQHAPPSELAHRYWEVEVQLRGQQEDVVVAVPETVIVCGHW